MIRSLAMLSGIVLALGLGAVVWAAPGAAYPRPCPNVCVPNVRNFGYFPTTWRQWPGEQRLDQTNPRQFGAEVLPTPQGQAQGQEQLPLPQATPSQPPAAAPQSEIPLPPGGMAVPPEQPPASLPPAEAQPARPLIEGRLPGPPVEPAQPPGATLPQSEQPRAAIKPLEQTRPNETPPREYHASVITETPKLPADRVLPAAYTTAEPAARPEVTDHAAAATLVLNGYCVVELASNGRWVRGDLRWTVVHKGLIYRFSGPAQRQQFLANPEAFAPVNSGNDPVLAVDESRPVPGRPAYCATYNGRLYLFSNTATQARFNRNPQRYAAGK